MSEDKFVKLVHLVGFISKKSDTSLIEEIALIVPARIKPT
jgi:hypothetical protein